MQTGETALLVGRIVVLLAGASLLAGCDELRNPVVSVTLSSQPATIMGTAPVQLLATVAQDGVAFENVQVLFSASRGTFAGGQATTTKTTDAVGLVVATLTLADENDLSPVDVTATAVEGNAMGVLTLNVETSGTRP